MRSCCRLFAREGKEWIDFLKQYDKEGSSIMKEIGFIQ